jgi:hypothetical protein
MIEGLKSSTVLASDMISAAFVKPDFPWYKIVEDTARYTVMDINALVDGNRNGKLDAASADDRSLVFWYNSDREGTYGQDGPASARMPYVQTDLTSPPPGFQSMDGFRDSENSTLDFTRDLEDFASLSLYLDPLLANQSNVSFNAYVTLDNNPAAADDQVHLNLFNTFEGAEGNARNHVMNANQALDHVHDDSFRYKEVTAQSSDKTFLNTFAQNILSAGANSFIFEAAPPRLNGQTTLDTVFPNNQVELVFNIDVNYGNGLTHTFKSKISLDLHDITDFYDTFEVNYTNGMGQDERKNPDFGSYSTFTQTTHAVVNDLPNSSFNNDDYLLFVHGWNMAPADKKEFAETAFKRLYWQGYSGRFGTFNWPTFYDADPTLPRDWPFAGQAANLTYFASEFQAWRSGEALKNVLSSLQQPDDAGNVHVNVMAHSMGNYVTAEALRLWRLQSTEPLVDTYIAMQGAVSAGVYGSDATDGLQVGDSSLFDLYRYFAAGTPQGNPVNGRPYMSDPSSTSATWSQSAATHRVNMFNEQDFALTNFKTWRAANTLKPLSTNLAPNATWPYNYELFYDGGVVTGVRRIDATTGQITVLTGGLVDENGRPGPNAYEIMAFTSVANSSPIGDKPVDWFDTNVNIQTDIPDGLDANTPGLDPKIRPNHSFEFNHDATRTWSFWERIKDEFGFTSTYDAGGMGNSMLTAANVRHESQAVQDLITVPSISSESGSFTAIDSSAVNGLKDSASKSLSYYLASNDGSLFGQSSSRVVSKAGVHSTLRMTPPTIHVANSASLLIAIANSEVHTASDVHSMDTVWSEFGEDSSTLGYNELVNDLSIDFKIWNGECAIDEYAAI